MSNDVHNLNENAGTCNITNPREFLLAGQSIFTVTNPKEDHHTFRISVFEGISGPLYSVHCLGHDGDVDYWWYLCMLDPNSLTTGLSVKSPRMEKAKLKRKILDWTLNCLRNYIPFPANYSCLHSENCARCGRLLTVEGSVENGIGPVCIKKMRKVDDGVATKEIGKPIAKARTRGALAKTKTKRS